MGGADTTADSLSRPAVAIVIPCYNHGRYLPEALASVRGQSYPHIECTIVDDGSTDADTQAALARCARDGWRVLRQANQGLAAARNAGVRATSAPFFVPLDADDQLQPDFVARLLPPLLADASLGYCYCHAELFGAVARVWRCPEYDRQRLVIQNLSTATAVIRRAAFDAVGGYSAEMSTGFEDWDFWLALQAAGYTGHCVPEPLFRYRKHATGSMLRETEKRRAQMLRVMIRHHRPLYVAALGLTAHDATSAAAPPANDEELLARLAAQAELEAIARSRLWRWFGRRAGPPRSPTPSVAACEVRPDPRTELARLKSSRTYRLIQAVKRTALYRWYARRTYGPDLGD